MTFFQLQCFLSLARTNRQATTAMKLGITPPTLSKLIRHMEDEFGVKFFNTTSSGSELTEAGELVYPHVRFIFNKYRDMIEMMNKRDSSRNSQLSIVAMYVQNQYQLLESINAFESRHKNISFHMREEPVQDIRDDLEMRQVDAAFVYSEFLKRKYPFVIPVRRDDLVAVVNKDHPFADRKFINLQELRDETFVLFRGDTPMYRFLVNNCIKAGFVPNELDMNIRTYTIMEYLKNHRAVSLLMYKIMSKCSDDRLVVIPLKERRTLTMSLVVPHEFPSEVCTQFMAHVRGLYDFRHEF